MQTSEKTTFRPYVEVLLDQLEKRADGTVLRYLDADVSGHAFSASIFRHARALAALGIGRGNLVAQFAPNCPDALAIRYAANLLGAATMFLPALANPEQRVAVLARLQPTLLVVYPETMHLVPDAVSVQVVYV